MTVLTPPAMTVLTPPAMTVLTPPAQTVLTPSAPAKRPHGTDELAVPSGSISPGVLESRTTTDFENGDRFPTLERLPGLRRACTRVLAISNANLEFSYTEARDTWQCSDALPGAQPLTGNSRSGHVHFAVGPRCDESGPVRGTSSRVLHGNRYEKGAQVTP